MYLSGIMFNDTSRYRLIVILCTAKKISGDIILTVKGKVITFFKFTVQT